ncbi:MAG: hypothetical protein OHK0022_23750 [Roseiflexaceae bacterium]
MAPSNRTRRTAQPDHSPAPPETPAQPPAEAPAQPPAEASAQPPEPLRFLDANWQPAKDGFFIIVQVHGTPEQAVTAVERLGQCRNIILQMDTVIELPASAWDQLPQRMLTTVQQAIVREDLRNTKRKVIAEKLNIGVNTITAYRHRIRQQFFSLPEDQRPIWVQTWLRRFPGMPKHAKWQRPARPPTEPAP